MSFYKDYVFGETADFLLHPVKETDYHALFGFLDRHLISRRAHSWELRKLLLEFILARGLRNPFSLKVISRRTGEVVGLRLCSASNRDRSLDERLFLLDERRRFTELGMFHEAPGEFWTQAEPDVHKVLRIELLYCLPGYEAQGLPKKLGKFNLCERKLQDEGYAGVLSENSAVAGAILKGRHFKQLAVINNYDTQHNKIMKIPVLFRDLRQRPSSSGTGTSQWVGCVSPMISE